LFLKSLYPLPKENLYLIKLIIFVSKDKPLAKELKDVVETPLMKQYYSIKSKYPDALLLLQGGRFL
jgi:hypothetical protein